MINLLNEDIQSHVFGDIIKRQVIGEVQSDVLSERPLILVGAYRTLTKVSRFRVDVAEAAPHRPVSFVPDRAAASRAARLSRAAPARRLATRDRYTPHSALA